MMTYLFISLGQFGAAYFPTADVAQAVLGLIIPLVRTVCAAHSPRTSPDTPCNSRPRRVASQAFLFGGLYLPLPDIPIWWKWAYYADPIAYSINGLIPAQFQNAPGCGSQLQRGPLNPALVCSTGNCAGKPTAAWQTNPNWSPNATYCPFITGLDTTFQPYSQDRDLYVLNKYGVSYAKRWPSIGYLLCFIGGFQAFHLLAVRFKSHVSR